MSEENEVSRFHPILVDGDPHMTWCEDGEYVLHSDYLLLQYRLQKAMTGLEEILRLDPCGMTIETKIAMEALHPTQPIQAHSKSEYKRLSAQGVDVVPPAKEEKVDYRLPYNDDPDAYDEPAEGSEK